MKMVDRELLVAVSMTTYNQESYIGKAIEGVLLQSAKFKYKLFITDDSSSDKTDSICQKYADKYPNIIDYERQVQNVGMRDNWISNLSKCIDSGAKYIAICEGDDYWTDLLKLEKQVSFLNKYKNVNIVHTNFDWLNESNNEIIKDYYNSINYSIKQKSNLKEYFLHPKVRTLTICFRAEKIKGFFDILKPEWSVMDTALVLYLLKDGEIGYIDDSTGVYTRGINTTSSSKNAKKQFEYWKNSSNRVKFFFYHYYRIEDAKIKRKLDHDFHESMFNVAVPAKKYVHIIRSLFYKMVNLRLTKSNIGFLLTLLKK